MVICLCQFEFFRVSSRHYSRTNTVNFCSMTLVCVLQVATNTTVVMKLGSLVPPVVSSSTSFSRQLLGISGNVCVCSRHLPVSVKRFIKLTPQYYVKLL